MFACFLLSGRRDWASLLGSWLLGRGLASPRARWLGYVGNQGSLKNSNSHIDASHSRQPLVKGERLVRYEVNAVMTLRDRAHAPRAQKDASHRSLARPRWRQRPQPLMVATHLQTLKKQRTLALERGRKRGREREREREREKRSPKPLTKP